MIKRLLCVVLGATLLCASVTLAATATPTPLISAVHAEREDKNSDLEYSNAVKCVSEAEKITSRAAYKIRKVPKSSRAIANGKRRAIGTYKYGSVVGKTKEKVGYKTNIIRISEDSVVGTGDFTCFTDKIGEHDNLLRKGDCATKGSIDNPMTGTIIRTTNMLTGKSANFIKNDNGGLPNAVLDIWKTGVKKLGIKTKNYNNIKFAGCYSYSY